MGTLFMDSPWSRGPGSGPTYINDSPGFSVRVKVWNHTNGEYVRKASFESTPANLGSKSGEGFQPFGHRGIAFQRVGRYGL